MSRRKPNPSNELPSRQPCSQCGRVPLSPRLKHCPFCVWQFKLAIFVMQERIRLERYKSLRLQNLRFALRGACEFLKDFDMTAINQAIEDAAARQVQVGVFNEEDACGK